MKAISCFILNFLFLLFISPSWAIELSARMDKERYFDSEEITAVIFVSNLEPAQKNIDLMMKWTILGKEMKREWKRVSVNNGTVRQSVSIKLKKPIKSMIPLEFQVEVYEDKNKEVGLVKKIKSQIFPKRNDYYLNPKTLLSKKILLYDPAKKIHSTLDWLEIPYQRLENFDLLEHLQASLVIIGPNAMKYDGASLTEDLEERLKNGLSILVLEQNDLGDNFLFDAFVDPTDTLISSLVFKTIPLQAEIQTPNRWGKSSVGVASAITISKKYGPLGLISMIEPFEGAEPNPKFFTAPALNLRVGKGNITFNQLNISNKIEEEPLSLWWLTQLLKGCSSDWQNLGTQN